jgi:DNA-binding MarR family transcriptional regulator
MAKHSRSTHRTHQAASALSASDEIRGHFAAHPVPPNTFRLGYLIHDVSRMRKRVFDKHFKPEGITRSQWWVLANLSRYAGTKGIMNTDLAELLDVAKVTLGGIIDRLESAGYVYRRINRQDRRAKQIFITEEGYAVIERMKSITEQLNRRVCSRLTQAQISATEHSLMLMKDTLREMLAADALPEFKDDEESA